VQIGADEYSAGEMVTLSMPSDKKVKPMIFQKLSYEESHGVLAYEEIKDTRGSPIRHQSHKHYLYYSAFTEEWRVGKQLPENSFDAAMLAPESLSYTMSYSTLEGFPEQLGLATWHVYHPATGKWMEVKWRVDVEDYRR
jgi:hypothetical protein